MSARDKFADIQADYWDCEDAERLTFDDPISALEEWVESHLVPGDDAESEIRGMGDVSVDAYTRNSLNDADITSVAEQAMEVASEHFGDNYGDPDGDPDADGLDSAKHLPVFEAAVRGFYADARVWRCEVIATVVLTPDEVLELMRAERPEWFAPGGVPMGE